MKTEPAGFDTGRTSLTIRFRDRVVLAVLVIAAIESVLYYGDYWFLGGHPKHLALFVILSYAVFRGPVRSIFSWGFFQFLRIPGSRPLTQKVSVDVLTTAMPGEPYDMFDATLRAIQRMSYSHATYLLDGGNDERLKTLCKELDVIHVDCQGIPGAKAGKINHCLKNHSRGEFLLIMDPDHRPEPDFLERALPSFQDRKVGFVQVVQAYYNERKNVVSHGASEQTYGFYGPLMMSLDGLDMAIAIGANCLFRRAALDSIGGHAVHLAEDACTSLRLHGEGWKSRYVPYRASYGLVPEDLQTFFKQQLKWASGMFDLFIHEYPKWFRRLNLQAKLYYFFAGTHYLNGLAGFITVAAPILLLFFQVYAVEMPITGFLLHVTPYILLSFAINMYVQRWYSDKQEHGIPWRSMLLEKGTWHIYALSFIYMLARKKVPYLPTPKTGAGRTSLALILPHIVGVGLSLAAVAFPFFFYHRIDSGTRLMMLFALMNIVALTPVIVWGLKNPENDKRGGA
ncbi:MAG: glycosyltransferase family 2 protein [Fibrobacterota bacterium]